ncbi:MAG: ABC transporter ATP-binding protein [Actinomycetota bacterium]|nr:ABC transporter ATP-binding protein [Actinomycetota bacterium]
MNLIECRGLTKSYGGSKVVNGIDLEVPEGSIFGFLGPNGSGKTTTIRMILGLISPTSGEIRVFGEEIPKKIESVLPKVGAVVEGPGLYPSLSPRRYLERMANHSRYSRPKDQRNPDISAALARVGLDKVADRRSKALSLGMKQRLSLANALLFPRQLLILDEPTNGMDPQGIVEMRELITELASEGSTIFISSHILFEIEQLCSHVAVVQHGNLLFQGELDSLRAQMPTRVSVKTSDNARVALLLSEQFGAVVASNSSTGESDAIQVDPSVVAPEVVAKAVIGAGFELYELHQERPTLEEAFVSLTGARSDVY